MTENPTHSLEHLLSHRRWVQGVARRLLRDEQAAEDVAQEAWVRAMASPPDPERDPKPWLRRVLKNLASNTLRGEGRRQKREDAWRPSRERRSPDALVAEAEQHKRLVNALMDLEEPFKKVLVLRFYEGLGPKEIAEQLDVPVGTVNSRIARAIERMKTRLDEEENGNRKAWIAGLLPIAGLDQYAPAAAATATTTTLAGILIMTLSKPKIALLAVLLLGCLVGGGIWLASDSHGDGPRIEGEAEFLSSDHTPTLEGRDAIATAGAATAPAQSNALSSALVDAPWMGRVLDTQGVPVKGAHVFALPAALAGLGQQQLMNPRYGRVRTDEDGAFALLHGDVDRPRLVAWAEGYLPASVELDGRRREEKLELVLGDPWRVTVRVEDAQLVWPAECEVYVWTDDDTKLHFAADPKQARVIDSWWAPESGGAERTVAVSTLAPVYVDPVAPEGYAAVPAWIRLEYPQDQASFQLVQTARITLQITDAATKQLLPSGIQAYASIADAARSRQVDSDEMEGGTVVFETDLSPRRYVLEVSAPGWTTWKKELTVREAGQEIELPVALDRLPPETQATEIVLRIRKQGEVPGAVAALAAQAPKMFDNDEYRVLLRPTGTTKWRSGDPKLLPDGRVELRAGGGANTGQGIEPGAYDLLVAQRKTGRAAFLPGVHIYEDRVNEFDVTVEPGSLFRLNDLVGRDVALKHLQVRSGRAGVLPLYLYRMSPGPKQVYTDADGLDKLLRTPREPLILGPFPSEVIEVLITDAKGAVKAHSVRGTP